jgi:hypothetical protein
MKSLHHLIRRLIGASGAGETADLLRRIKELDLEVRESRKWLDKRIRREGRELSEYFDRRIQKLALEQQQLLGERGIEGKLDELRVALRAVLRRLYLDHGRLAPPHDLLARRFRLESQNEEDGITWALLNRAGIETRRFVEIGAGVNGGNSGFLARECGWSGLMVEVGQARSEQLRRHLDPVRVAVAARRASRENVNEIVETHGAGGQIDLLSIDIDGNDYWVWEALAACTPRVVIVEYNAWFGPERRLVVPYDPDFDRNRLGQRRYYGASLAALEALGRRKGYRLVLTEPRHVNAFFVRVDLALSLPTLPAAAAYAMHGEGEHTGQWRMLLEEWGQKGLPLEEIPA